MTRVESEETQDYVRETMGLSQEEVEEVCFVPSAISVPQKPLFRCDNRCSEETLGEESYTTNLCQQCCNKSLVARGDKPLTKVEGVRGRGEKGASWKVMENAGERPVHTRDMGVLLM